MLNKIRIDRWHIVLVILLAGGLVACDGSDESIGAVERQFLAHDFLLGTHSIESPVPTSAFEPRSDALPDNRFEGTLTVEYPQAAGAFLGYTDLFDLVANPDLDIKRLPPLRIDLVQSGSALIPVQRGAQAGEHPHWEILIEPGVVWDEPGDGGYSRASLPFALQERNANCTHNGLLTFLFTSSGQISRLAYQVASETCAYLQFDMWGAVDAHMQGQTVLGGGAIIQQHRRHLNARLPVRPIAEIGRDYPGVDPSAFRMHAAEEVSTYGFMIDGVHYSGGCETRYGPYPFCESLALPSYSLAKTIFAGTMLAWMEQQSAGAGALRVTDYVPECAMDDRWQGVTLEHLVDMASGNFDSTEPQVDEFYSYTTDFIDADNHAAKIAVSCELFERKAAPGSTYVYHSTETYIAGTLMNAWLRQQDSAVEDRRPDIHRDVLVEQIMKPLRLSPLTWSTRRTYDEMQQPYTGFGLTFVADDVLRFARFMMTSNGVVDGQQILSKAELDAALQRNPNDPGLPAGSELFRYNNGVKAMNVAELIGCEEPLWVPFMSGYGGISVVMLPNHSIYYVFSDGGNFHWAEAADQSSKIKPFCEKK